MTCMSCPCSYIYILIAFYIALFSALEHTHYPHVILNECYYAIINVLL